MAISSTTVKTTKARAKRSDALAIPIGDEYHQYIERVKARFSGMSFENHLFTTNTPNLHDAFMSGIPADAKQYHNCNACKNFINRYGGLVMVGVTGQKAPVFWDIRDTPEYYHNAVLAMIALINKSDITGVFLTNQTKWGTQYTGGWEHFGVQVSSGKFFWKGLALTPEQRMAELTEDYRMLCRNIEKYDLITINQVATILDVPDALYRREKVLDHAKWLVEVKESRENLKGKVRDNMTWAFVAGAPAGWCHIGSTMIGTLLEDMQSGTFTFNEVKRRFDEKMHPERYRMQTAPVKDGNIAQAEQLFEKLGLDVVKLDRRFAILEDLPLLWRPQIELPLDPEKQTGQFGHLRRARASVPMPKVDMTGTTTNMSWKKFEEDVLGKAIKIECYAGMNSYGAIIAPAHPDAPNIFQYSNNFSHYTYSGPSTPGDWNLKNGSWVDVTGIVTQPTMWDAQAASRFDLAVYFLLDGCVDRKYVTMAIFPELLKSEFHSVKRTIQAHSESKEMLGKDQATACGIRMSNSSRSWYNKIRVTTANSIQSYILDRWE